TLLPAMLSVLGHRVNSLRIVPRAVLERRAASDRGFWTRLARTIMRRPVTVLLAASAVMLAIALPALQLHLTSSDNRGLPGRPPREPARRPRAGRADPRRRVQRLRDDGRQRSRAPDPRALHPAVGVRWCPGPPDGRPGLRGRLPRQVLWRVPVARARRARHQL